MDKFVCSKGKRYSGSDGKWCKVGNKDHLDMHKILGNFDAFVEDMRLAKIAPWPEQSKPLGLKDQVKVCPNATPRQMHNFHFDSYSYHLVGGDGQQLKSSNRTIFIPSRGRHNLQLLERWPEVPNTSIVVFVPWFELMLYEEWRTNDAMLFLAVLPLLQDVECIGFTRHHIFHFAQMTGLAEFWMIDDSVDVTNIRRDEERVDLTAMLEDVEKKMDSEADCLLMGINTVNAYKKTSLAKLEKERYPQNRRAPTSIVRVYCGETDKGTHFTNHYCPKLPCREDIVFAAKIIKGGNSVLLDRRHTFTDDAIEIGGVAAFYS